jgi:Tfp pilus assembly major pilin PilA
MRSRFTKFLTAFALVAALAVGGAAIASATHTAPQKQQAKVVKKHAVKRSLTAATPASEPTEAADSASAAETPDSTTEAASTEAASTPESAADTAAQDAACKAAGISPTADNVNFDDASGTCTLDNGSN